MQVYFGRASAHFRILAAILDLLTVEVWGEEIFPEGVGVKGKNHPRWRHRKPDLLSSVPLQNNACTAG